MGSESDWYLFPRPQSGPSDQALDTVKTGRRVLVGSDDEDHPGVEALLPASIWPLAINGNTYCGNQPVAHCHKAWIRGCQHHIQAYGRLHSVEGAGP